VLGQTGIVEQRLKLPAQKPRQNIIDEFRHHLLQERRLSRATMQNYVPFIDQFLSERFRNKAPNLSVLRGADITGFVQRHPSIQPRASQTAGDGTPMLLSLPPAARRDHRRPGGMRARRAQLVEGYIAQISAPRNGTACIESL
jgi:hypothetical protein